MEAKDTVMSLEDAKASIPLGTLELVGQKLGYDAVHIWEAFRVQTERQADISFKAGVEVGVKQGRREVIEWIRQQHLFTGEPPVEGKLYQFLGCYLTRWGKTDEPSMAFGRFTETEEWEAKEKEWGC